MNKIKTIGIFAHVDAGKTTLTEQLLFNVGAIKSAGRVDNGNTQTDSDDIEKERGISIYSMPTSYDYKDQTINIIDTPGHVDFVAEVQRSMMVLDGAILVMSAKEGVQSHTKLLFKTLQKMKVPTLIFINKIDRLGTDIELVIEQIRNQLTKEIFITQSVLGAGSMNADVLDIPMKADDDNIEILSGIDDTLLDDYIYGKSITADRLSETLVNGVSSCKLYPVIFGSALKNIGIGNLLDKINDMLPLFEETKANDISGIAFKMFYKNGITKAATIKLISGEIHKYDYIGDDKITAIFVWKHGKVVAADSITSGQVGYVIGARHLKVGEYFGDGEAKYDISLGTPTLKVKVSPKTNTFRASLLTALNKMAECDPYLTYELSEVNNDIFINLFGRVQMEIIEETLRRDYSLEIKFDQPMTIYRETLITAAEETVSIFDDIPIWAGVGFRVKPLPRGRGIEYTTSEIDTSGLTSKFHNAIREGVFAFLDQGLMGWELTDMEVSLIHYRIECTPPSEFRRLAPLVLFRAIKKAKTKLLWPINEFILSVPVSMMGRALNDLRNMQAIVNIPDVQGDVCTITGTIPSDTINDYQIDVHEYTSGKGYFESHLSGYDDAADGVSAEREKMKVDAGNEKEYLMSLINVRR